MPIRIEFSPDDNKGGWRCPYCSSLFCSGGPTLHHDGCLNNVDYDGCVYIITPIEIIKIIRYGHNLDIRDVDYMASEVSHYVTDEMLEEWQVKYPR